MSYEKYFKKTLVEDGSGYVASVPNTAGRGGAVGNAAGMYSNQTVGGQATDTSAGDFRVPHSLFDGKVVKRGVNKRKKKK